MHFLAIHFKKVKAAVFFPASRQEAVRRNLVAYMTVNPLPAKSFGRSGFLSRQFIYSTALVILLLIAGSGTALAANKALPGDQLYSVKTHITEPLRAAFTVTANNRAAYQAELASKRVEEANTLSIQGKLDDQAQAELAEDLDSHIREMETKVNEITTKRSAAGEIEAQLHEAQDLLAEAKKKFQDHDYGGAAKLSRQASETARNGHGNSSEPRNNNVKLRFDH